MTQNQLFAELVTEAHSLWAIGHVSSPRFGLLTEAIVGVLCETFIEPISAIERKWATLLRVTPVGDRVYFLTAVPYLWEPYLLQLELDGNTDTLDMLGW